MSNYSSVGLKVIQTDVSEVVFTVSEIRVTLRSSSCWFRGNAWLVMVFEYIYSNTVILNIFFMKRE